MWTAKSGGGEERLAAARGFLHQIGRLAGDEPVPCTRIFGPQHDAVLSLAAENLLWRRLLCRASLANIDIPRPWIFEFVPRMKDLANLDGRVAVAPEMLRQHDGVLQERS